MTHPPPSTSSLSLRQGKVTSQSKDAHPPQKTPHVSPSIFYRAWGGFEPPQSARAGQVPKRTIWHKFGKGAKRCGDCKSCRHVLPTALVDCTAIALVDPTALVARERPTAIPVKRMNKKQLHWSLHCTTKKLVCAKKKVVTTSKKLTASKAKCTILAKLAQDRCKESNLAHQTFE